MADAALSASGMSDRHREHLPKQQPQQPLRPSMAAASHTNSTSENGNKSYGTSNQPVPNKVENQGQPPHRIRPLSFNAAGRDYGSALPSLGPHPGPNPLTRVNSAGGGGGHSDAFERHHPPHTQASSRLQPQAAYLQQRATGTTNEHVFNAHDSVAAPTSGGSGGAPASVPAPVAPSNLPVKAAIGTGHDVRHGAAGQPYRSSGINSSNSSSNSRRMVGPYQLAKTIGAGSMGKVKVALDTRTNKRVAAKIIPLQQPDAPIYFPSSLDTTSAQLSASAKSIATQTMYNGPVSSNAEPWRTWLMDLALESRPDLAVAIGFPVHIQRKVRLLQPRERYTTKDRERRENKDIRIVREVAINRLLHHPHICMLHDVVVHPNHYYIFQELVSGGQMLDYIISHGRLKEKHARKFARQIASAIDYCHHNSIVHRDLKIENILISANGNIKLIDFGLSNLYSPRSQLSTFCGSLYFAAPELLNAQPYTGPEVDLWSFGVVLYVLVCGKVPFDDQSMPALHAKIKRGHVEYPTWLSPECKHLLSRLLVVSPQRRATMGEVVRHPWMCKGYVENPLINNYLPVRTPLISPDQIDRDVVHEMAQYIGFGFGSEEEIRIGLEAILTEDWYRNWLKDNLSPHINSLRDQLQKQNLLSQARQTVDASSETPSPLHPLAQGSAGLASGTTLASSVNNKANLEGSAHQLTTSAAAVTIPAATASQSPEQRTASSRSDGKKAAEVSGADFVRKRSSFWKRSSTFIAGGLTRSSQKANLETAGSGLHNNNGLAPEKPQFSQFRALSGRIFSDGRNTGNTGLDAEITPSGQEYPAVPLSAHSPRMYIDAATGMVSIWKSGKLAPPDTDCAAIQQAYHDLVATDPLLSIYFLVKERRDRELRSATYYSTQSTSAEARPLKSAASNARSTSQAANASVFEAAAVPVSVPTRAVSNDAWVKLERISERPVLGNGSNAKDTHSKQKGTQAVKDAARDLVAVLGDSANTENQSTPPASSTKQNAGLLNAAASQSSAIAPGAEGSTVDQTTAAIEALSLHPQRQGSGLSSTAHNTNASHAAAFPDSRKKRGNIFKRFSVIVKNARSGQKSSSGQRSDSASRIIHADNNESGYMEINVHDGSISDKALGKQEKKEKADKASTSVLDNANTADDGIHHSSKHQLSHQIPSSVEHLESKAANTSISSEKHAAAGNLEKNTSGDISRCENDALASDKNCSGASQNASEHVPATNENVASDSRSYSHPPDSTKKRQYLNRPLYTRAQSDQPQAEHVELLSAIKEEEEKRQQNQKQQQQQESVVSTQNTNVAPDVHPKADSTTFATRNKTGDEADQDNTDHIHTNNASARMSHSSNDFDGASSMFTGTDTDEGEADTHIPADSKKAPSGDCHKLGNLSSNSDRAALLEKAKREIDSLDEHEGVGLLDQTPELSYRTAEQMHNANFETRKRRGRSSSNTVVRVLSEIVRDNSGGSGISAFTGSRTNKSVAASSGDSYHSCAKSTSPQNVDPASRHATTKTILRHSSTSAINKAGAAKDVDIPTRSGAKYGLHRSHAVTGEADTSPVGAAGGRPDILRSHSHTSGNQHRGLVLPERIAELPEPTTPAESQAENALRIDSTHIQQKDDNCSTSPSAGLSATDRAHAMDSKCDELSGVDSSAAEDYGKDSSSNERQQQNPRSRAPSAADVDAYVEVESDIAGNDIMSSISAAPPRADEYLKPVFLKGLFSVATTSTRSPSAIRDNLLNVLSGMPLRFHEGKGYFTCSMATTGGPTNIQQGILGSYAHEDSASNNSGTRKPKKTLRIPGVDRRISFRKKTKHADEASQALTATAADSQENDRHEYVSSNEDMVSNSHQSVAESLSDDSRSRHPKPVSVNADAGDGDAAVSVDMPLSQPRRSTSSSNAICFQIFLVRMPLLGLCGLQFRRVSGPTWKYKDICSEILKRLKL